MLTRTGNLGDGITLDSFGVANASLVYDTGKWQASLFVNNLFDDLGPFLPSGLDGGNSRNIVSSLNDLDGREFYLGARFAF